MRFGWRDVLATLFVMIGLAVGLSVTLGWNWPLVQGGVRAGIIGLGVMGIFACSVSGWSTDAQAEGPSFYRTPFFIAGTIVGVFVLGIGVVGLFAGTVQFLAWMMAGFAALWIITLVHRLLPAGSRSQRPTPA
jgi:hypothetical protein